MEHWNWMSAHRKISNYISEFSEASRLELGGYVMFGMCRAKVRGKYVCCHSNVPLCLFYAVFKMKDAWHHTCSLTILASFDLLSFFLSTLSTVQNCCCEMLLWRSTTCLTTGRAMLTPCESVTPSPPSSSSRLWVHAAAVHVWQAPFLLTVK